ncbi:hypothetical protein WJX79_008939 [Trebouxia sp. C0005]
MYGVQPEHVRFWDRIIQAKGSLTFADWKTCTPDNSEVMQGAEEPTSPVTLLAAQLHAEYVTYEFHALQERAHIEQGQSNDKLNKIQRSREELQKAVEKQGETVSMLGKELHETRATCVEAQQAAQLKITELEASSRFTRDLQEQLSRLATEKAGVELRLQAKIAEVVSLHNKATASQHQTQDLKTRNSMLEQEVGHLKKSLANFTQINSKMSQAHNEIAEGLQTQLDNLRQEKNASDRALQSKHDDFQEAQDGAAASQASLSETRHRCIELHQELSCLKGGLAEANTIKVCAIQESEMKSALLAQQDAELAAAKQDFATCLKVHQELAQIATDRVYELQDQFGRATVDLDVAKEQISELQRELAGKRNKVTNAKLAIPALTHRASVQMRENRPAQLQQQLVQKGTGLSSVKKELAYLQQELSQTHQAKYEATKEAQKHSAQLQKQLDWKVAEDMSAQLHQQLAQKGTDLSSAEQELTRLRQELSQAQQSKHEAMREAQKHSAQLQKQLDWKVTEVGPLQHKLTSLDAELGKMTKAKEDGMD